MGVNNSMVNRKQNHLTSIYITVMTMLAIIIAD